MTGHHPTPIEPADPMPLMGSYDDFMKHPWVNSLRHRYKKDRVLAECACKKIVKDLEHLNQDYIDKFGRVAFTSIDGRAKREDSFFRKLYNRCQGRCPAHGITDKGLVRLYSNIKDLCGVRFSCPYLDEVTDFIEKIIRPGLTNLSYATELGRQFADKDYLDKGDGQGYRSYHFYVKVPTPVDIFGQWQYCICEVQGRSELQHVWAVKAHNLLYKMGEGWELSDNHVRTDMKSLSDSLRSADESLMSIRDRIKR